MSRVAVFKIQKNSFSVGAIWLFAAYTDSDIARMVFVFLIHLISIFLNFLVFADEH